MPGIEFVGADADGEADEDVLDTGPRRPVPRWVWALAVLLVIAVGVGALISSRSDHAPDARPSASTPSPAAPDSDDAPPGAQISVLASDGTSLFWVAGDQLFRAGPVGRAALSVPISPAGGDFAELQLVPDPVEQTIWVVSRGAQDSNPGSGSVEGFSTEDLSVAKSASAPSLIDGAAAVGGALYVLSGGHLLSTTAHDPDVGLNPVAAVGRQAHDLVAAGHGLLYLEGGNGSVIRQWTPSGVSVPAVLPSTGNTLGVVGSTLFVAGLRSGRSVLDRRDRFKPSRGTAVQGVPTKNLQILTTGRSSLLVLGTDADGLELACVRASPVGADSQMPVVTSTAATSANVAVLRGVVYEAVGASVRPADLGTCPG